MTKEMRPNQWYSIRNPRTRKEYWPPEGRVWRFQPSTMKRHITDDNIIWPDDHPDNHLTRPRFKTRFEPSAELDTANPVSTWINSKQDGDLGDVVADDRLSLVAAMNQEGTKELRKIFGEQVLEYPKPVSLMGVLVPLAARDNDLVMDFFAGSSTTAHAVLTANREDGGQRRFIMVQLPEPTADESTARKAGFATVADIGKERIRRVIKRMKKEAKGKLDFKDRDHPEDLGFRVFKLAESHFRRWSGTEEKDPGEWAQQMELFVDPLLPGWDPCNVIHEVALREGYSLTSRIEQLTALTPGPSPARGRGEKSLTPGPSPKKGRGENVVYRVTDDDRGRSFLICLDDKLKAATPKALGLGKDDIFICRDVALSDELAANLALQCRLKTI